MSTSASEAAINPRVAQSAINDTTEDPNPSGKEGDAAEEEGEEEEECGFCLFMKGGGCKESFVPWDNCTEEVKERKEDVASKCGELYVLLRKCMEAHSDYYEPLLRAEKVAQEEAVKQLEKEVPDS